MMEVVLGSQPEATGGKLSVDTLYSARSLGENARELKSGQDATRSKVKVWEIGDKM